jgi:hypothetical protein
MTANAGFAFHQINMLARIRQPKSRLDASYPASHNQSSLFQCDLAHF